MRVPVAPDGAATSREDARDSGDVRGEDRCDEDVAADQELRVDAEELGLVWELEEECADRRRPTRRRVCEEGVL